MPHKIRNWDEFQHYKTGRAAPPWIKLYRDLLNDVEWFELPAEAAKFLISCWLIAAEGNGVLPDNKALAFRLRISLKETEKFLRLCKHWIICDDSNVLAKGYQDASPEEEREEEVEEEREKIIHQPKQVRSKDSKSKDFEQYFQGLYDEARDILVQRQRQYGPANIESLGIPGVFSRMSDDKMSRIKKALSGEFIKGRVVLSQDSLKELQHPSVRDALMDAANYCLILVSLIESQWSNLELDYDPGDGVEY